LLIGTLVYRNWNKIGSSLNPIQTKVVSNIVKRMAAMALLFYVMSLFVPQRHILAGQLFYFFARM